MLNEKGTGDMHEVETAAIHGAAWHSAGKRLDHLMTVEEALHESGLDGWMLKKYPMHIIVPRADLPADEREFRAVLERLGGHADGDEIVVPYDGRFGHMRRKDWTVLGDVGPSYQSILNEYLFDVFKLLCDRNGINVAKIQAAGSLRGGRRVWVLLSLPDSGFEVGNRRDLIIPYLLSTNYHDGSGAAGFLPTTVNVVCMNTLNAALGEAYAQLTVRVRHTGDIEAKMREVQDMMAQAALMFGEFQRVGNELDERVVSRDAFGEVMEFLFPPIPEKGATNERIANRNAKVALLTAALKEEVELLPQYTATGGGERQFSYWTLLQAMTRFTTHKQEVWIARNASPEEAAEKRFEQQLLGPGAEFNARATRKILEVSGVR
jgi:phage/plasmid-like protein (TIGR03299 family)